MSLRNAYDDAREAYRILESIDFENLPDEWGILVEDVISDIGHQLMSQLINPMYRVLET